MIALYDPNNPNRVVLRHRHPRASILLGAALAAAARDLRARDKADTRGSRSKSLGIVGCGRLGDRVDPPRRPIVNRCTAAGFSSAGSRPPRSSPPPSTPNRDRLARVLSLRPLCALGLISYGVYLYHWPIDIVIDRQRAHIGGWPLFSLQTTVTLAVAIASYRIVEQPIRRAPSPSAQLRTFTPALALGLALALVGSTIGAKAPASTLTDVKGDPLLAATKAGRAAPPGSVRVLIVGNSVASLLAPAFSAVDTGAQLAVLDVSIEGCNFPPDLTDVQLRLPTGGVLPAPPCDPWWEAGVVERFRPQIVFWLMSDPFGTGGTYAVNTCSLVLSSTPRSMRNDSNKK